jgi:hypothetical protein
MNTMPTTKREFEMMCAAMIMANMSAKDGVNYPSNIAQDRAQELADALDRRGFFAEGATTERYRTPQPRRQQMPVMQEMVVEER